VPGFFRVDKVRARQKAHICQSTYGNASRNAAINVTLSGTRKVPVTSVAIIVAPTGSAFNNGAASTA
jgi:hypothetical protein